MNAQGLGDAAVNSPAGDGSNFMQELHEALVETPEGRRPEQRREQQHFDGDDRRSVKRSDIRRAGKSLGRLAAVWGFIAMIGGTLVTAGIINNPLQTKAAAAEAQAKQTQRDDSQDKRIEVVEGRLGNIEKNGARMIELQLRATKRSLEADLRAMPENAPGRRNLESQLDQVKSDLGEK